MDAVVWTVGLIALVFGFVVIRGAPYVPSHRKQLEKAFTKLVQLTEKDVVVDLGAGDGIVLDEVSRRGARAIGLEINPLLVCLMKLRFLRRKNVSIKLQDYLLQDKLPEETTIVYVFATSRDIKKIDKKMQQWSRNKKLMLVSYGFSIEGKSALKAVAPFKLYLYDPES